MKYRDEKDSLGTVRVPAAAYYGAQTQRAMDNFPISGIPLPTEFIQALALIKMAAARVNRDLGFLPQEVAEAIENAAREVLEGKFSDQFLIDVFQTGSGTSTNMNINEVIASRANEMITGTRGGKSPVHPNDHVNRGQSSNDVIPTAIHLAALTALKDRLVPALERLEAALLKKAAEFDTVRKIGRTHLQDAVPMTLGQEFSGFARQTGLGVKRVLTLEHRLAELALGGTAVGSGLNAHPQFAARVIALIAAHTHLPFREAENHFEAQAARDASVEASGVLRTIAVSLVKIANDIRWLASGPRCGIGEIEIPAVQPGSSIMPGKVNPVIAEAVIQVAAQVMGNDATIMVSGQAGNFQLNVMLPVIAYNLLQSISLLSNAAELFEKKCIRDLKANRQACEAYIEKSLSLVTGLVPHIGYDRAAELAKQAYESGKTIREIVVEEGIISETAFNRLL